MTEDNLMNVRVLEAARRCWTDAAAFRQRRDRYKRFTYGDQWSDMIRTPSGQVMTEGAYARQRGKQPLSNNMIRRLVKCIVGRFRALQEEKTDGITPVAAANNLEEMDSRALEEFLISGCAVQRVSPDPLRPGLGVRVDNVSPGRFFINRTRDPRGWDTELVGMLHDMSPAEVVMRFACGDAVKARRLRELYRRLQQSSAEAPLSGHSKGTGDFDMAPEGRCRVIEVWTLESAETLCLHDRENATVSRCPTGDLGEVQRLNARRKARGQKPLAVKLSTVTRWVGRWMAPDGTLLHTEPARASDGQHPFVVKLYPLTDGEVHSLVEDVIDQQVYVNRLITLIDHVISSSAKGALLFPVQQKIAETDWEDIARMWASPDAIIPYSGRPGLPLPQQVASNSTDIGARELLALQMKMFEDVSGVTNALMGKPSGGVASAERFESEIRNATVAINDILKTFDHFRKMRDNKMAAW